jgi:hypothetical protein
MTTVPKPSRETIKSRPARLPPSNLALALCSPVSPRVSPLITPQFSSFSTKSSALPPSSLMLPSSSILPSSSMLPNQPMPMHWPTQVPSGVSSFYFCRNSFLRVLFHYILDVAARVCRSPGTDDVQTIAAWLPCNANTT